MASESIPNVLITGGAGFIGSNVAAHLLRTTDATVRIFDNFSRPKVEHNIDWLTSLAKGASRLEIIDGDVRDAKAVRRAAQDAAEIYHFAAQVAVTTSLADPVSDCDINIKGTLNVLEAARNSGRLPFLLFTSTNKVYGALNQFSIRAENDRYCFADPGYPGVDESTPLDLYSPYGCSKGSADQYVRDYARIYRLPTVVFRMSCIAGPRQFGTEDQGWVAHFLYSALAVRPITIYGDGRQVRDVLHVADLVEAIAAARRHVSRTAGQIYNVGGGVERSVSVLQVLEQIGTELGQPVRWSHDDVRPGDQPIYITNTAKLTEHTGWEPRRGFETTLSDLHQFWKDNQPILRAAGSNDVAAPIEVSAGQERLA